MKACYEFSRVLVKSGKKSKALKYLGLACDNDEPYSCLYLSKLARKRFKKESPAFFRKGAEKLRINSLAES